MKEMRILNFSSFETRSLIDIYRKRLTDDHAPKHRQDIVDGIDVLWEAIDNAAEGRGIEQFHGPSEYIWQERLVQHLGAEDASEGQRERAKEVRGNWKVKL